MNQYMRMILVLAVISMVAGTVLAFSYEVTNPKIREQERQALEQSVIDVIPGVENITETSKEDMTFYIGEDNQGNRKGIAFKVSGSGFNGPIEIMVGYDPNEGKLTGIQILSMSETPGLGAKINDPDFTGQFIGKSVNDKFIPKEDINIITGATISPTAVANAIKSGLDKVTQIYPVGGDF
ncbi:MAG: RnfABCDGE type electron transport complex subunit G [Tepidanaerobacteraceae bacterium]|jgi:electron transport complex protein RnfG